MLPRRYGHCHSPSRSLFFFNDTATTEIYTLPLHDALPILGPTGPPPPPGVSPLYEEWAVEHWPFLDRKSTRLNSSHLAISDAVFCLTEMIERLLKDSADRHGTSEEGASACMNEE